MSSTRPELKFSDISDERSFYRKYQKLATKPANTIRIVDKGDYYSVFAEDSQFIAELIYRTTSVIKESQGVQYVTLSSAVLSNLLQQCLFEKGLKVEIYDKTWELIKFASPGNIESVEDLFNTSEIESALVVVALKVSSKQEGKTVGFCFVDTNSKEISISEFMDNDLYSNLESLLIQIDAKEVVIQSPSSSQDPDYIKFVGVIDRCGASITELKPTDFGNKDIEQDLARLIGDELALAVGETSKSTVGLGAASAIIQYLGLLTDDSNFGGYKLKNHVLSQFMKLDSSALKSLNLFSQSKSNTSKNSSLFDLLNHCKSVGGVRLLHQWIKQPLVDLDEITARHQLVEMLIQDTEMRTILQSELLPAIPDVRRLNRRLIKATHANLEDVVRIYQFLIKVPDIIDLLEGKNGDLDDEELKMLIDVTWTAPIKESFTPLMKLQEMVETTVDLESLDRHEFVIKPDYDEQLLEYRQKLNDIEDEIRSIHQEVASELGLDPDKKLKLELHQNHGWCMRLTRTEERSIRGKSKFIELQTVKAGVFFTTEKMREISAESVDIQRKYSRQQASLVKEIVSITATYAPVLEKLSLVFAHLDVLISFAHASAYVPMPYVRPKMHPMDSKDGRTILKEARHPCVEMQDEVTFIANDVELIKQDTEFLIITGPNMGGKSTYIRQLGVIALMAQIGCFVPATEAELCVFDAILARVGAGDSQLKGVSTFMVEMLETASILKTATTNSLIIIDELGRGTSTYDGFGLAWAISEFIAEKVHCFTLFATHFHELTRLAEKISTVKNLHLVAHVDGQSNSSQDITLLYKVEPGISDQSFGIHVAEVVKFPKKIISMAKRKASELEGLDNNMEDPYVGDKRTKCSQQEISEGSALLKKILKEWRSNVDLESGTSEEAVAKLKDLVNSAYKDQVEASKFLQEVLQL
jgi:DNA mismatch repair protein MSH2